MSLHSFGQQQMTAEQSLDRLQNLAASLSRQPRIMQTAVDRYRAACVAADTSKYPTKAAGKKINLRRSLQVVLAAVDDEASKLVSLDSHVYALYTKATNSSQQDPQFPEVDLAALFNGHKELLEALQISRAASCPLEVQTAGLAAAIEVVTGLVHSPGQGTAELRQNAQSSYRMGVGDKTQLATPSTVRLDNQLSVQCSGQYLVDAANTTGKGKLPDQATILGGSAAASSLTPMATSMGSFETQTLHHPGYHPSEIYPPHPNAVHHQDNVTYPTLGGTKPYSGANQDAQEPYNDESSDCPYELDATQ